MLKVIKRELNRIASWQWTLRARVQFVLLRQVWPKNMTVRGPMGLTALGAVSIGENVTIVNRSKDNRAGVNHPTQLVSAKGAFLRIGSNVGISGASIICMERIEIGDNVLFGVNASVYDSDLHPMDSMERRNSGIAKSAPVIIEDDVWLCANVLVLKGVRIGARSVIAANSVVTKDIPADTLAAGAPARAVGKTS